MPYPLPTDSPLPTFTWMRRLALPLFLLFIVSVHLHLQPLHRDIIKPRIGSSFFHLPASCFPYLSSPTPSPAPPPPDGFPFISPSAFVPLPWFLMLLRYQWHPPLLYRFIQVLRWIFFFGIWRRLIESLGFHYFDESFMIFEMKVLWFWDESSSFQSKIFSDESFRFWIKSFVILGWKFQLKVSFLRWKFRVSNLSFYNFQTKVSFESIFFNFDMKVLDFELKAF